MLWALCAGVIGHVEKKDWEPGFRGGRTVETSRLFKAFELESKAQLVRWIQRGNRRCQRPKAACHGSVPLGIWVVCLS